MTIYKKREKSCKACRKRKTSCNCGRPLFDGKNAKTVVAKLEKAFAHFMSNEKAAQYAGISTSALYRYFNENPEFRQLKDQLRTAVNLKVRAALLEGAQKDPNLALKWLERTEPEEFGLSNRRNLPPPPPPAPRDLGKEAREALERIRRIKEERRIEREKEHMIRGY